jgi:hypothetical protein
MQEIQESAGAIKDECRFYNLKTSAGTAKNECRHYKGRAQALQRTSAGATKDE